MKLYCVDLYEYFGIDREENKGGMLTCILHENSPEINSNRLYPAMLVLPGGGYAMCSDRESEPIAENYFTKGYNTFILKYSVAPSRYPTQLIEASMAMAYIRNNASEHNTDKNHVASIGFSAGGHLCGSLATLYNAPEIAQKTGLLPETVRPDAVILSYAVINPELGLSGGTFINLCDGNEDLLITTTIDKQINENTPPLFIWHTATDTCVDVRNAFAIAMAAQKNNVPFSLHIFEYGPHGLSVADASVYSDSNLPSMSKNVSYWIDMSLNWLKEHGFNYVD